MKGDAGISLYKICTVAQFVQIWRRGADGLVCLSATHKATMRYIFRMGPLRASAALLVTFGAKSDMQRIVMRGVGVPSHMLTATANKKIKDNHYAY